MRIVALEEHVLFTDLAQRISAADVAASGWVPAGWAPSDADEPASALDRALDDTEQERIGSMDEAGITMQVLSAVGPGAEMLAGEEGVGLARDYNDRLAQAVERQPDRFAAFAHLPMKDPEAAADELERCVTRLGFRGASINGTTDGLFLDDPRFAPILSRAEAIGAPSISIPDPRHVRCATSTSRGCRTLPRSSCPMPVSAGMRKQGFTFCAWPCRAHSTEIRI